MKGLKDLTDEQFVDTLYFNLLARPAEPEGRKAMLGLLRGGTSRLDLVDMFFRSPEFTGVREVLRFSPPGHFYSPYPSQREIAIHSQFNWRRDSLPAIDLREAEQMRLLEALASHYPALPFAEKPGPARYGYDNPLYSFGDGIILFTLIQHLEPRRIVEVGSGHSSCAMLDAVDRLPAPGPSVTFIEPFAASLRSLVRPGDLERHTLHEKGLQELPLALFGELEANDILFIDSSHVSRVGSDVNYFFFEILPVLKPGVFVHVHDIFFPFEYPALWLQQGRAWNEAYLLRAFLEYNEAWRIEYFSSFMVTRHADWFRKNMPLVLRNPGGHIWLSRAR